MSSAIRSQGNSVTSARQVLGDTSGTAVPSGMIGERVESLFSGVNCPNTATNITSISLSPGIWSVSVSLNFSGSSNPNYGEVSISTVSGAHGSMGDSKFQFSAPATGTGAYVGFVGFSRILNISSTTTAYCVVNSITAVNTSLYGKLNAIRIA